MADGEAEFVVSEMDGKVLTLTGAPVAREMMARSSKSHWADIYDALVDEQCLNPEPLSQDYVTKFIKDRTWEEC